MNDANMFGVVDLECNEVFVDVREKIAKKEVSTADPVTTAGEVVTVASVEDNVAPITTTTTDVDDELTLYKYIYQLSLHQRIKAKQKMIELEKPLKKKDQIALNEEVARKLEAEMRAKMEEEEVIAREKDEANRAVIEEWDDVHAIIDADRKLVKQIQAQEREQLSIKERSKLLAELIESRRKYLAAKRAEEIKNKPPTKAHQKSLMCTYMRNIEGYKPRICRIFVVENSTYLLTVPPYSGGILKRIVLDLANKWGNTASVVCEEATKGLVLVDGCIRRWVHMVCIKRICIKENTRVMYEPMGYRDAAFRGCMRSISVIGVIGRSSSKGGGALEPWKDSSLVACRLPPYAAYEIGVASRVRVGLGSISHFSSYSSLKYSSSARREGERRFRLDQVLTFSLVSSKTHREGCTASRGVNPFRARRGGLRAGGEGTLSVAIRGSNVRKTHGNEYFCFLDDFSRYFQIPIDHMDQEKTTFTFPFRIYAYRRMPFGLCNAPATFQRIMIAIFHDMIKESIEVFMDNFFFLWKLIQKLS
uniref:Reverse transcriptase domain-containing protein n=1 Tax=Tanacetum cinerariifolium TaxID=118510 RepID=A0A699IED1_TANCI|nr:reverse transcriptase domain-containing protein [Tanacetum cinerariifolium]